MALKPFAKADPFLQLILLFLLSFVGLVVFMLMANGLLQSLWGISFFSDPLALQDYQNPQTVQINRLLLLFQHLGLFVIPAAIFAMLVSSHWKSYLGFVKSETKFLLLGAAVMIASLPLINGLSYVNQQIRLPSFLSKLEKILLGMEESAAQITEAITGSGDSTVLIINLVVIAFIPALGEEMIFRGVLIPILRRWTGKVNIAVWLAALLFSAMHMQFYGFFPRLILGAILGYLYVWSGSLWTAILAHFANNALALILLFFIARGRLPAEIDTFALSSTDLLWVAISIIVVSALLIVFYKQKKPEVLESELEL